MDYAQMLLSHLRREYGRPRYMDGVGPSRVQELFEEYFDRGLLHQLGQQVSRRAEDDLFFESLDRLLEKCSDPETQEDPMQLFQQYLDQADAHRIVEELGVALVELELQREEMRNFRAREAELESKPWPGGYKGVL